jgi:hypothetical protein
MNSGMLWFDNDPKTALTAKIARAAEYYRQKYGRQPNVCLIHPSMMENDSPAKSAPGVAEVMVRPYRPVLPGHLWIGVEEKN